VNILKLLARLGGQGDKRVSPRIEEQKKFEKEVRDQLLKLKQKGINLPVFTL